MSSPELEELLALYFEGALDDAGAARLEALLAADPRARGRFEGLAELEGLLRVRATNEETRDRLVGQVTESVRQEERRRALTHRVMDTLRKSPSTAPASAWYGWAAAAAAAIVLIVLLARQEPVKPNHTAVAAPQPVPTPPPTPPPLPIPQIPPPKTLPHESATPLQVPPAPPLPRPDPAPASSPPAPPPTVPPPPVPAKPPDTRAVAILIEKSEGASLDGSRDLIREGSELPPGRGLETAARGLAVVHFPDRTRLELGPETALRGISDREKKGKGKRLTVLRGTLSADVTRQPADEPLTIATPHGEVRVLGTSLRVSVDAAQTAVSVKEGRVKLIRAKDGRSADLSAGHYAILAPDLDPSSRSMNAEEVVLLAAQGRIVGEEWKAVSDRRASAGVALEAGATAFKPAEHVRARPSYVNFTFFASADREYRVWLRAASQATGDPWNRDLVTVDAWHAGANLKCPYFGTSDQTCVVFGGISSTSAYSWVSGFSAQGKDAGAPLTVRFAQTGLQTLRLYVAHPSIRVDAVWLSVFQVTRPPARQFPPPLEGK